MLSELKRLLAPFRLGFACYVLLTLFRQALVLGGGYGLVLLIRTYEDHPAQSALIALVVLISYKVVLDTLDQVMGWGFARHISYPMFRQLSVDVFGKILSLGQEWQQNGSSGARRGEITNGLSKFAQTSESLAREVCPLPATAFLSLFLLRPYVAASFWLMILPAACALFCWLSFEENRRCVRYRQRRYNRYPSDYALSIECMEMHADVVRYNQAKRIEEDYGRIHDEIQHNGLSDQPCGSLWGYAGMWGRISEAWEPIKLFLKISSATSALVDVGSTSIVVPAQVSVEFRDVEFDYRQDEPLLNKLSLFVEPGQKVGLVGRTGCGKSTLLKLVERPYDAHAGTVFVGGTDV
jgi:ABC-type bacteriocin/lantibiotic exporter with double-glycine peptidase domain